HGEIVTFVRKENDQWWLVKTKDGEEGYSFSTYLSPIG
ncbi:MAG: SH3 domain-containing protein, partial [Deinococcales bacterium]|nr:SH3 domain-containing protein [Chitinophagaceae bacterium]